MNIMQTTTKKKYTVTVNDEMAQSIEGAAKAMNVTPAAYIWLCIESQERLRQENSNLKARLRDASIRVQPIPIFNINIDR